MSEWKEVLLLEVAKIQQGYAFKSTDFNDIEGHPVIKIKNIASGIVNLSETQYYNKKVEHLSKYFVKNGDILIAMTGSHLDQPSSVVGRVSRMNENKNCLINQRTAKIIPIINYVNSKFLYYQLKLDETLFILASNATGSANQANISSEQIYNLPIYLPPLPEQEAIAEVLSSLDDKIDLLHRNNKTLEQMAETLFRQWFVEEAEDSWEEIDLKSICVRITKGTTPTTLNKSFTQEGVNFIKAESLNEFGGFIKSKISYIDEETHNLLSRSQIKLGDILFTIAGTIGRTAIATRSIIPANTNQAVAILRANYNIVSSIFLKYIMKSDYIQEIMESKIVHAVQPNLSLGEISETKIKLPPKKLLYKFDTQATILQEKIESNIIQLQYLENLRDTLLPKLMSGAVKVNK